MTAVSVEVVRAATRHLDNRGVNTDDISSVEVVRAATRHLDGHCARYCGSRRVEVVRAATRHLDRKWVAITTKEFG